MSTVQQVSQVLAEIEQVMRESALWQSYPPEAEAFNSSQPFSIDTMSAQQWLQWVLLPRMTALLHAGHDLPRNFAVAPYFEVALPEHKSLLIVLQQLDNLLNIEDK